MRSAWLEIVRAHRLGSLACTLSSQRHRAQHTQRIKSWRDREIALRWTAAGFLEAEKSFRNLLASRSCGSREPRSLAIAAMPRTWRRPQNMAHAAAGSCRDGRDIGSMMVI
jgi:hypothetical protein